MAQRGVVVGSGLPSEDRQVPAATELISAMSVE